MRLISSRAQRRARDRASRGIADHAGEVADQKDDRVPEILKVFQLAQQHGVAEMQIGRGRIEAGFHAQRLVRSQRFFELGAQFGLLHNLRRAFLDVGELFVNGGEWTWVMIIARGEMLPDCRIVGICEWTNFRNCAG